MKDFKICVENKEQFDEILELCTKVGINSDVPRGTNFIFLHENSRTLDWSNNSATFIQDGNKHITLSELRKYHDQIVLSRNDVNDATHVDCENDAWFVSSDEKYYWFVPKRRVWREKTKEFADHYNAQPIQKEEKETQPELNWQYWLNRWMNLKDDEVDVNCFIDGKWKSLSLVMLASIKNITGFCIVPKTINIEGQDYTKEEALKLIEEYFA